ncbi:MAG: 4-(cytidine 5'-diphospho)-2-C-methyl-D-erythritol kinase [Syntrophomonadaceae bacterium]|nr:4-(cytidine 5'-diphospho)-2-C-methyl-D-erythritol kinase [Syntrophomonadaceae bacterium]
MHSKIEVTAPAKINLTLDIKGKRADGYHELETVMQQIDLLDRITIELTSEGSISVDSNSSFIPHDKENLACQAAALFLDKYGCEEGVRIFIEKSIPIGAGLAGGSSDAAAVLWGLNRLLDCKLEEQDLLNLGAQIGSDVPFCLLGGSALARGRGELLQPLKQSVPLLLLLVKPDFQVSTAEVYKQFNLAQVERFPDTRAFLESWRKCDIIGIAAHMENVLESVSIKIFPEIALIKEKLKKLGALNALMSGSGPSVFAVFTDRVLALKAMENMRTSYREVFLVSSYEK